MCYFCLLVIIKLNYLYSIKNFVKYSNLYSMLNKKLNIKYFLSALFAVVFIYSFSIYDGYEITADAVLNHIKFLASDELGGRFPGTHGDSLAEHYAIEQFQGDRLTPIGDDGYREKFDFVSEVKVGTHNSFSSAIGDENYQYTIGHEFYPMGFSSNSSAEGTLVFIGYGINAPDQKYNDLSGVDLKGKIAVVMRYSPGSNTPHDNPFSKYEMPRMKCNAIKEAGAKGIIFFTGPASGDDELLTKLRSSSNINENIGIPVIDVKRDIIEKIFELNGKNLRTTQMLMDSLKTTNSFALKNTKVNFTVSLEEVHSYTANIIGYLEGTDPVLKNEVIVVGAHMDHLGDGMKYGSLDPSGKPAIHHGADDNASGDAGVFELAHKLSTVKSSLKHSYIFMLFSGEEAGLLGSAFFTKSELYKQYNIITMINMDMIGRLNDNKLNVEGAGTSSIWKHMVDSLNNIKENLTLIFKDEGFGPSDQSSFYAKDLPVLQIFTGLHSDYHRPTDTWDKINSDGEVKVLNLVYDIITCLDQRETKPDFIKTKEEKEKTMTSFRVTLGIVPDYSTNAEGMAVMGVKDGGPAANAGLKAGDIIIKFGSHEIKNIYDYTYALGDFKPGDETEIVVKRGTEEITLKVTFTKK
jgi:aminopeptidase YwaD